MRIKLISPRMSLRPMDSEFKRRMSPPLSLLTLAALIPDHQVYIEDENTGGINLNDTPDLVGITVSVDTANRAYRISDHYRQKGVKVILGGIHVSANPQEGLEHADSVCIGEAEGVFRRIVNDAQSNRLERLYYNQTPTSPQEIPIPCKKLINESSYLYTNILYSSRGCPHKCEFCYNSNSFVHRQYRNRPVENIITEIKGFDRKQAMFIDDNFIGNPQKSLLLINELSNLNITWHAAVSTDLLNHPNIMDRMSQSGCRSLFIGFESISEQSINSVNKKQNTISRYETLIKELHDRDIMVNASIALGFDYDSKNVFRDTLNWLVSNKVETMTAHILTPYPGTILYKKMLEQNRIIDFNYDKYNTANVVYKPALMTPEELKKGYLWLYKNFYSIKTILKRMPDSKKQRLPYFMFNLFYRKFGKIVSVIGKTGLMNKLGIIGSRLSYDI